MIRPTSRHRTKRSEDVMRAGATGAAQSRRWHAATDGKMNFGILPWMDNLMKLLPLEMFILAEKQPTIRNYYYYFGRARMTILSAVRSTGERNKYF